MEIFFSRLQWPFVPVFSLDNLETSNLGLVQVNSFAEAILSHPGLSKEGDKEGAQNGRAEGHRSLR